ncbi:hypothetical protein BCL69_107617 [Nitrosomonas communis]|uniref:Uncharacterized protein n=1 Tax=Nitrosomonas communis TaxID=44574 RepID=A0A5D3YC52_9PROT|nr:hypothetical protein BCL69_107617 [Nitrosomonas communis]
MNSDQHLFSHFTLRALIHSDTAIKLKIDDKPSAEVVANLMYVCNHIYADS